MLFFFISNNNSNKHYHSISAMECKMFLASPSLANKNKLDDLLSRKHDTYNCLCGKLNVPTSKPRTDIVWR